MKINSKDKVLKDDELFFEYNFEYSQVQVKSIF